MKHPINNFSFALFIASLLCLITFPFSANPQRRLTTIIPYEDTGYKYKVANPGRFRGFERSDFDDSAFDSGDAPFGTGHEDCPSYDNIKTRWPSGTPILVRKTFDLPRGAQNVKIGVAIDNDVRVYINGRFIGSDHHEGCARRDRFVYSVPENFLNAGSNLIALMGSDDGRGGSYLDVQVTAEMNSSLENRDTSSSTDSSQAHTYSTLITSGPAGSSIGPYGQFHPVNDLPGLDYAIRCYNYNDGSKYGWDLLFRNRYRKAIRITCALTNSTATTPPPKGSGNYSYLAPQTEGSAFLNEKTPCGGTVKLWIWGVEFVD
jgi:hypothetical protein